MVGRWERGWIGAGEDVLVGGVAQRGGAWMSPLGRIQPPVLAGTDPSSPIGAAGTYPRVRG